MRRNVAFCWRTLHLARQQSCGSYAASCGSCVMRSYAACGSYAASCGSCGQIGYGKGESIRLIQILSLWDLN
ncbi:hypothetical protein M6B38_339170 [Iris pallida]|uniref:Secreted protein n=1 Tax=Iris pallida TaxID=29817 RepID=A0AAX6GZY7_IRIPA|nr:hypothetical protein M6B38_339170 [Iris pallida]